MPDPPAALVALVLCYARIQACLLAMPGWGERFVPVRIKVGLAMGLTPLLFEAVDLFSAGKEEMAVSNLPSLAMLAGGEVVVGLSFGLLVRLASYALGIAASAVAATTSLAQLVGGPSETAPHPVGNLTEIAGFALLMAMGYPVFVVLYLVNGFELIGLGHLPQVRILAWDAANLVGRVFGMAMVLASPFILGSVLYQCLQGIISRVMPSLPVVFIGAPAAISLALIGLAIFIAPILGVWAGFVLDILSDTPPG